MTGAPEPLPNPLVDGAAAMLASVRRRRPRVHAITNSVAMHFTANVLLAVGAVPSMTISSEEIGDFVASADALLVNLGTFDSARKRATLTAVDVAVEEKRPWVLDPVFIDRSPPRAAFARELAAREPGVIRANAAELGALIGAAPSSDAIMRLALDYLTVIALTGPEDLITDGARLFTVSNGAPMMARVTAIGDALGAVIAAFLAVDDDPLIAAAGAVLVMGVAGEQAAAKVTGPGLFGAALIDALDRLDASTLRTLGRVG